MKCELKQIGEIITGSTPSTSKIENYSEMGSPWVTPTDINTPTISETQKRLSKAGEMISRMVPKGTILVTSIASIGKNTMLTVRGSFNQQINGVIPNKENDSYFLLVMSEIWSRKMKYFASSGTMPIVNKTEFKEMEFYFSKDKIEQTKIGEFFKHLDNLITVNEHKLFNSILSS
ncbi:hypothetical protein D9N18_02285 [Lactococcus raffinolactis]|uniref:restriction endonuclease subunit S n=1 Tax=Pseudolactococcus raffinolactis TaxID=1366 RepID=UPI001E023BEF|nr:restriction endonuclease subunit S [Lactococcus raffinolactis]MBW9330193.1 hypothetical protein [Lactococcus raffinolactis]